MEDEVPAGAAPREAVAVLVEVSQAVLAGSRTPEQGAREVWVRAGHHNHLVDVLDYIALADDFVEAPEAREETEAEVRAHAEDVLRRYGLQPSDSWDSPEVRGASAR